MTHKSRLNACRVPGTVLGAGTWMELADCTKRHENKEFGDRCLREDTAAGSKGPEVGARGPGGVRRGLAAEMTASSDPKAAAGVRPRLLVGRAPRRRGQQHEAGAEGQKAGFAAAGEAPGGWPA